MGGSGGGVDGGGGGGDGGGGGGGGDDGVGGGGCGGAWVACQPFHSYNTVSSIRDEVFSIFFFSLKRIFLAAPISTF